MICIIPSNDKTQLACPAFGALSMKSLYKGPSPSVFFCLCFCIAEDLFYCTFSGVKIWPSWFAIVNVYKLKLGVFQVRHAKLEWLGLGPQATDGKCCSTSANHLGLRPKPCCLRPATCVSNEIDLTSREHLEKVPL